MRPAPRLAAPALALLALARTPLRAQAPNTPDPIRPDPRLTPGATVAVGQGALCTPGYARGVRYVPADVHRAVFREHGLAGAGVRTRDYEVDHLVPLSLGGANDLANLWPESRRTLQPRCNQRGHGHPMIAIPRPDGCGSLHLCRPTPQRYRRIRATAPRVPAPAAEPDS